MEERISVGKRKGGGERMRVGHGLLLLLLLLQLLLLRWLLQELLMMGGIMMGVMVI